VSGSKFEEGARRSDVQFRLPVHPRLPGVVGPLEQQPLAVLHQLDAGVGGLGVQVVELLARQHHRRRDVVLHLHLVGRVKVGPQLVNAPRAARVEPHPQIVADQLLVVVLQLVPEESVDAVHREVVPPVVAPVRPVIPFDREDELPDRLGQVLQPLVVFYR
jgi:hypothetical protein